MNVVNVNIASGKTDVNSYSNTNAPSLAVAYLLQVIKGTS